MRREDAIKRLSKSVTDFINAQESAQGTDRTKAVLAHAEDVLGAMKRAKGQSERSMAYSALVSFLLELRSTGQAQEHWGELLKAIRK